MQQPTPSFKHYIQQEQSLVLMSEICMKMEAWYIVSQCNNQIRFAPRVLLKLFLYG